MGGSLFHGETPGYFGLAELYFHERSIEWVSETLDYSLTLISRYSLDLEKHREASDKVVSKASEVFEKIPVDDANYSECLAAYNKIVTESLAINTKIYASRL